MPFTSFALSISTICCSALSIFSQYNPFESLTELTNSIFPSSLSTRRLRFWRKWVLRSCLPHTYINTTFPESFFQFSHGGRCVRPQRGVPILRLPISNQIFTHDALSCAPRLREPGSRFVVDLVKTIYRSINEQWCTCTGYLFRCSSFMVDRNWATKRIGSLSQCTCTR